MEEFPTKKDWKEIPESEIKLKAEELFRFLDTLPFEHITEFSFNGTNFLLLLVDAEEIASGEAGQDAEYARSDEIDGWDLNVFETLSGEIRKRKLFHEILECNLRDRGYSLKDAHNIAKKEEERIWKTQN